MQSLLNRRFVLFVILFMYTMFVQVFETHRVFETANYLALHMPYDLENFTEDVFMHDIYCTKFSERESKICVLEA